MVDTHGDLEGEDFGPERGAELALVPFPRCVRNGGIGGTGWLEGAAGGSVSRMFCGEGVDVVTRMFYSRLGGVPETTHLSRYWRRREDCILSIPPPPQTRTSLCTRDRAY